MPKTKTQKSRQSPSVERQLALALLRVIECLGPMDDLRSVIEARDGGAKFWADLETATNEAREVLKTNNYGELETIATRVKRIEADIAEAVRNQDGAKLAILGAALDRAKSGKPPLETEKKPRKKKAEPATTTDPPAEKKTQKKKGEGKPGPLPLGEAVPCQCLYPGCGWEGSAIVDSACPVCSSAVVAVESEK